MASPRWRDWNGLSRDYAQYHRNSINKLCHAFGIPLIVFCVVRWTQLPGSTLSLAVLALPVYFAWSPGLAAAMTAILLAMSAAAAVCPAWIFLPLFIIGWILQLVGHRFEGRSPAFTENALHLLVGPFWILGEAKELISSR
jgi:uncharacterized membrane protein YGL010W